MKSGFKTRIRRFAETSLMPGFGPVFPARIVMTKNGDARRILLEEGSSIRYRRRNGPTSVRRLPRTERFD
uniref:Uncharacterized protein n=1 Tax=Leptospira ellisii TaxID=2023197 RepID=A0A2N0BCH0_9LEPT|nr:hypothetical protein CH379_03805 [Leptospira ellisii]